jgi:AraC-like DNA-binding protein
MQAKELLRNAPVNQSFLVHQQSVRQFINTWHFHEELELVYIEASEGTKFIGDSITPFGPGTLVLLGSYLPHSWQNDGMSGGQQEAAARSTSVFFSPACFGASFFDIPEMAVLKQLFNAATRGLEVTGAGRATVIRHLQQFADCPDYRRPLLLLEILIAIRDEAELEPLSSPAFLSQYTQASSSKVDIVIEYVLENFRNKISLDVAAGLVNMNTTAFSRYFRKTTNKTFVQFVNEVRIGYACKLFSSSDRSISEIAYASGYNNLSHFNKQFKTVKAITPSAYAKQYAEKTI